MDEVRAREVARPQRALLAGIVAGSGAVLGVLLWSGMQSMASADTTALTDTAKCNPPAIAIDYRQPDGSWGPEHRALMLTRVKYDAGDRIAVRYIPPPGWRPDLASRADRARLRFPDQPAGSDAVAQREWLAMGADWHLHHPQPFRPCISAGGL
ncbi:MAG: hypothetical protein U0Q22_13095 [Acidimicrobiales bacterium]